ncbi:MAG: alginate lyase family protein [Chloroflexi bacterium]|nr:alginate lyase family protein [Chloroflexota bacterium]
MRLARENREREPIRGALARLAAHETDPLAEAYKSALRGQLLDDREAGYRAAAALNRARLEFTDDIADIKRALAWLSVAAMLRDHPAWEASWLDATAAWLDRFSETGERLRGLWLGALSMAAGILLENDEAIQRGADVYRSAVDEQIHPEGFLKGIADLDDTPGRYEAQVSGSCALVLLAEMAALIGLDLWSYDNRAVSVFTAVTYTHFYYFFPEKWRWEVDVTRERTNAIMRREGAFMELVNRRGPPTGIEQFLAEQRPLFCLYGGGLTTLTHGLAPAKKRRWRFW